MIKQRFGLLMLVGFISFGAGFASAWAIAPQEGTPDQRLGIVASMSGAKVVLCPSSGQVRCFRVFLEVRSSDNRLHNIAENVEEAGQYLDQSFAYLSDGGVCKASVDRNLPRVRSYWSANRRWFELPSQPITVSAQQPFAFPVTFVCDQPIESGDMAQIQISVAVGLNAFSDRYEDAKAVHFKWPQVRITSRIVR